MSRRLPGLPVALVAALMGGACATQGVDPETRDAIAELRNERDTAKKEQAEMRARLDELAAAHKQLRADFDAAVKEPEAEEESGPDPKTVYAIPIAGAPVRGPMDAWVTVVEVAEFQCPYCGRAQSSLESLRKEFGPDVRFAFVNFPLDFHDRAKAAAHAAACAHEQGKFWEMHDLLYENQKELGDAELLGYAKKVKGLDARKWQKCIKDGKHEAHINQDQEMAAAFGVRGTPTFFINGRMLQGAQPTAAFRALVQEEIAKAKISGIPRADYYARAVLEKGKRPE